LANGEIKFIMGTMADAHKELLGDLLKATSRSLYLSLRVLPAAVRTQMGLAYLLARMTDTIADTEIIPVAQRLEALRMLADQIAGTASGPLNLGELARQQGQPAERVLLEKVGSALALLQGLDPADLALVRRVLQVITSGQELDLRRFAGASGHNIIALETEAELDDYTFRVAGCVGEFWTRLCRAHLFPQARLDEGRLLTNGVRFGKGLQLVNILRDLPADLRNGRCYLPRTTLTAAGLTPETLLTPAAEAAFRTCYHQYLDVAEGHLRAGWDFTNTLPRGQVRIRLACAWMILIGMRTIERLRAARGAEIQQRVKVTRAEVRAILLRSVLTYPFPKAWRGQLSVPVKAVASGRNLA
jgi:farnesyl-diphosphate farnesyltransferase